MVPLCGLRYCGTLYVDQAGLDLRFTWLSLSSAGIKGTCHLSQPFT